MTCRVDALCIDANDAAGLATFWAAALRWELHESSDEVTLVPTDRTSFRIVFEPVSANKTGKNRMHLDVTTTSIADQRETVRRMLEHGARHVDIGQRPEEPHVVLADPEGNEFCVIEPENSFLAGCGRLGSITCDGSRAAGYFWSGALGWPLVWDQEDETAVRAPDGTGPFITWGPPVRPKVGKNRLRLRIASVEGDQRGEVDRLVALGATRADIGPRARGSVLMADPDGNEFSVVR